MSELDTSYIDFFNTQKTPKNIIPRDVEMYTILFNKDMFISRLIRQIEILAVDCVLQQGRNMFLQADDYTDECYYDSCTYSCSSGLQYPDEAIIKRALQYDDVPNFKIDDTTYLSYYLATDIKKIINYIIDFMYNKALESVYSITDETLYKELIERYQELDHQRMKYTYFTTALVFMDQTQTLLYMNDRPKYYIKYKKPNIYLALNYKSNSIIDSQYASDMIITAIQNSDAIVDKYIKAYSVSRVRDMVTEIAALVDEDKIHMYIDKLPTNLKSSLFEHVYDGHNDESAMIRDIMLKYYPDRVYEVPYLINSMREYYEIITGKKITRGRPRTKTDVAFRADKLSPLDEDNSRVLIHIFNLTISSSNVIASLIKPNNVQVRILLNDEWQDPVYYEEGTRPENMSNVYLAYIYTIRRREQLSIMERALKYTYGIYGYYVNNDFYLAETNEAAFKEMETKKTGAGRNERKGRVMNSSYNGQNEYAKILPIYKSYYGSQDLSNDSLRDLPIMLDRLGVVMRLTTNFTA